MVFAHWGNECRDPRRLRQRPEGDTDYKKRQDERTGTIAKYPEVNRHESQPQSKILKWPRRACHCVIIYQRERAVMPGLNVGRVLPGEPEFRTISALFL